jgi:hypothetical protein
VKRIGVKTHLSDTKPSELSVTRSQLGLASSLGSCELVTDSSDGFAVNAFGKVSGGIVSGGMESKLSDTFGV